MSEDMVLYDALLKIIKKQEEAIHEQGQLLQKIIGDNLEKENLINELMKKQIL